MNRQDIFNRVVTHARAQGRKAVLRRTHDDAMRFMYRGPDNTRCFIGCLIEDRYYRPDIEGVSVHRSPAVQDVLSKSLNCPLGENNQIFLRRLQAIHDQVPVDSWENSFEILSKDYRLTVPPMAPVSET